MHLPKLNLRDLFWLVVVVAMGIGWWAQVRIPTSVLVGQPVRVVRQDRFHGCVEVAGIVSSVCGDGFSIDTSHSKPVRDGIVIDLAGNYLGAVSRDDGRTIEVIRSSFAR